MSSPRVSCIMLTANRPNFVPLSIGHFLNSDFRDAELIIVDDGRESIRSIIPDHHRVKYFYTNPLGSIGLKRNFACEQATGDIIMHWDDDDYYPYDWMTRQVKALDTSGADIVGLNSILFYSPIENKFWGYENKDINRPWISGATMAYRKSFWESHRFKDIHIGEDYDYIWNNGAKVFAHEYPNGFIATLHAGNTTLKPFENPRHKKNASQYMDVQFVGDAAHPENSRFNYIP